MGGHTFVGDEMEKEQAQSFIDLIYETADGFVSVAVMQNKEWLAFTKALDKLELREDPRFLTAALREENKDARLEAMQAAILGYTSAEVIERLEALDVPCAPVLTRREMIRHPQIEANGLVVEHDHPVAGRLRQTRPPARFSETSPEYRFGAPVLGADTATVLGEVGYSTQEIDALLASGAAAQAVKETETA